MRIYTIILACLVLSLTMASCQKFVDIKKSSNQFFLTTANDCQLLLDNYTKMNTGYPVDGEISSDDYFITSATYQTAAIPQEEKDLYTWNANALRASATPNWQNPFQVVYNANLIIETLEKLNGGSDNPVLLNTLKGSALFYRAYCFWILAQLYTKPYSSITATQDPGIPLRLKSDINDKPSRGTVQDTYDRIIKDLLEATTLLPNTSSISTRPNKAAAYAMLARTYLSIEDYSNAWINANEALKINSQLLDYNSINKTSATPFIRFNVEVIFHTMNYYKIGAPITGPILAPGRATSNIAKIDPILISTYSVNDLRSSIFYKENSGIDAGTYRFTGSYENSSSSAIFFTGLAVDEMYLIRSECYARAGKLIEAMTDLNTLLKKRWVTNTYIDQNANSIDEALDKILLERRKELVMRGLRWTDLRRLNKDPRFKKDLTRTIAIGAFPNEVTTTYTLFANDPRYTLLLPKEVIDNSALAQNIR